MGTAALTLFAILAKEGVVYLAPLMTVVVFVASSLRIVLNSSGEQLERQLPRSKAGEQDCEDGWRFFTAVLGR